MRYKILLILSCLFSILSFGNLSLYCQSLPVGSPVLEDFYRREQLLGSFDRSVSFAIRPLYPSLLNNRQISDSLSENDKKVQFSLMPVFWKQQFNSDHPEGLNDGAMIPARGYQAMLSGGFYAKYRWLSVQFMPEFAYAENKEFRGFPDELSDDSWNIYYNHILKYIDIPERFGTTSYKKAFWGQSSIRLTFDPISIGFSNENIWWGPGMQNSLLMTNSAPGFKHVTLNTVRPIRTFIGSIEGQLIGGRLDASGYPGIDSTRLARHGITSLVKPNDWRYLSGLILTYQPRWLPGLFLGAARSYVTYHQDFEGKYIDDYLPVLVTNSIKSKLGFEVNLEDKKDELASVFMRWVSPKANMEFYWEYGREDNSVDKTDLLLELEYSDAYIVGFRKLTQIRKRKDEFIDVHAEITQLSHKFVSWNRINYKALGWYCHYQVVDGYTHNGQFLGSGIGTSSNMQSVNISWVKKMKRIGLELKRVSHDENFWSVVSKDYRTPWVDISGALIGEWDYKKFVFNAMVQTVGSKNYQFLYAPIPSDPPLWWDYGMIRYNVHAELGISYFFN